MILFGCECRDMNEAVDYWVKELLEGYAKSQMVGNISEFQQVVVTMINRVHKHAIEHAKTLKGATDGK